VLESLIDRITRASLRFKWVVIALSILVLAGGALAVMQLNQELLPKIEFPQSILLTMNPGTSPEEMQDGVTIPIEQAVEDIEGVVNIESTTTNGVSVVVIYNEFGIDIDATREEILDLVQVLDFPEGTQPPELLTFSMSDLPLVALSVSSDQLSLTELKALIEADIVPELMKVDGVADVQVSGGQELPSPEEMAAETTEPSEAEAENMLPEMWQMAGDMQGIALNVPSDVTPQIIQGIVSMAPQLLDALTPDNLRAFSPEVLGWLPGSYIETLDPALREELDQLAQPAGGLGTLAAGGDTAQPVPEEPPALSGLWIESTEESSSTGMPTFETAADLMESGFTDSAGELLNMMLQSGITQAPQLIADLTPDVILWLTANEEGFLENLSPEVLRLLSPEVIAVLPGDFLASLDPTLRTEIAGGAGGGSQTFLPTETINRLDGVPSLSLVIYKDSEANTVSVSHAVFDALAELEAEFDGLRSEAAFEQASFIEESISGVAREGGLGAIFAVIVILIFLSGFVRGKYRLSWQSTLVTAVSIPLSVFMAFALFKWLPPVTNLVIEPLVEATKDIAVLGAIVNVIARLFPTSMTLNIMTLSGMTVAIGRVVDDSIVVLENIYRHIQRGEDMKVSVLKGTRDVAIAIFASTMTTVVVFLPVGLLGGIVGEFFLPFGISVTYALLSSFLIAITIVPTLAFLFIRKEQLPEEQESKLQRWYTPILRWALNHRAITLIVALVLFLGSMALLAQRPRAFMPEMGEPQISIQVDLPNGIAMADTDAVVAEFETQLAEVENLGVVMTQVGASGGLEASLFGSGIDQGAANIEIGIENGDDIDALTAEVRRLAEVHFGPENVIVTSGTLTSSAFGGFSLVISGDQADLADFNDQAITILEKIDGLANVTSNLANQDLILRVNGEPAVSFSGELETEDSMGVIAAAKAAVEEVTPTGITVSEGFQSEMQTEGFAQSVVGVLISIVAVYLFMVITFRSFIHPFTILFSLPVAIIGAALALWITNRVLGISVLVGLMMLVGIVVTNAIVLIDRVQNNRKKRGMDTRDALIEAGRTRLRPILMTAIAAMLALVPLALGFTEGALIAAELATVVIGGLFTSTLLTLLVVPVMYSLLDRLTRNNKKAEVAESTT